MRARIIALIILVLLVALPLGAYWYFTTKKTSSFVVSVGTGAFTLNMRGTFGIDSLPLADRALGYVERCVVSCTVTPVLPAVYEVTLEQTGSVTLRDTLTLRAGEQVTRNYVFIPDVRLENIGSIGGDESGASGALLIDESKRKNMGDISPVGFDADGKYWAVRTEGSTTQVGVLSMERFSAYKTYNRSIDTVRFDISKKTILVGISPDKTIAFTTNLASELEIPLRIDDIVAVSFLADTTKVRTRTTVYQLQNGTLEENIRFSDYIDISPEVRIGYIDKDDAAKLSLSNFDSGTSMLIRVDRTSPNSIVLRKGVDIRALIFHDGKPAYVDTSGTLYSIQ